MTKAQETIAISMAVTAVMGTMFVLIGIWSANKYTRGYVQESINKYDSTVTIRNQVQYDTIINRLNELKVDINE